MGLVRNNQDVANSVQVLMKPRKKVTANTGVDSGNVTRKKAEFGVQPSISAASSSSLGIVSRYPFIFQMAKGREPERTANPTPSREFLKLKTVPPMVT